MKNETNYSKQDKINLKSIKCKFKKREAQTKKHKKIYADMSIYKVTYD